MSTWFPGVPSPDGSTAPLAVLVTLTALVSMGAPACGSGGDDGSAGSADDGSEPAVLVADLQRSTLFDTRREFGLSVAATGDTDLQLDTIQLVTPLFEAEAPTRRDTVLGAGERALVMPLPYGTAICGDGAGNGDEAGDDDGDGDAVELAAVVDGEEVRVRVTVHPEGMLSELHERECAAAAVLDDVELALDGEWTVLDPTTATGRLTATQRTPGITAQVDELLGNVIFGVTTAETAPAVTVDDAAPTASVGVTVSAARCDPHALTEYKRTFVFVAVGRGGRRRTGADRRPRRGPGPRRPGPAPHVLHRLTRPRPSAFSPRIRSRGRPDPGAKPAGSGQSGAAASIGVRR